MNSALMMPVNDKNKNFSRESVANLYKCVAKISFLQFYTL